MNPICTQRFAPFSLNNPEGDVECANPINGLCTCISIASAEISTPSPEELKARLLAAKREQAPRVAVPPGSADAPELTRELAALREGYDRLNRENGLLRRRARDAERAAAAFERMVNDMAAERLLAGLEVDVTTAPVFREGDAAHITSEVLGMDSEPYTVTGVRGPRGGGRCPNGLDS